MDYRKRIDSLLVEYNHARRSVSDERSANANARSAFASASLALEITTNIALSVQRLAGAQIERIVTRCLSAVFGPDVYAFRVVWESKRNKTEARLVLVRDGYEFDPLREEAGGVLDVAAFGLRLSAIMLTRPPLRRVMILDEPFTSIRGREYRERIRDLVVQLAEELDVQFIINIDIESFPEFMAGKIIEL